MVLVYINCRQIDNATSNVKWKFESQSVIWLPNNILQWNTKSSCRWVDITVQKYLVLLECENMMHVHTSLKGIKDSLASYISWQWASSLAHLHFFDRDFLISHSTLLSPYASSTAGIKHFGSLLSTEIHMPHCRISSIAFFSRIARVKRLQHLHCNR